tara:strand:+ start:3156 stop:3287 length:132 start_codon:yes stop_codon:yes gene_type:complete
MFLPLHWQGVSHSYYTNGGFHAKEGRRAFDASILAESLHYDKP